MDKRDNLMPPWKPGQSGNPKGRIVSRVDKFKVQVLGKRQAKNYHNMDSKEYEQWCHLLIVSPTSALQTLVKADETPSLVKNYAMAILQDTKQGKTTTVRQIADKLFGGTAHKIELTGPGGTDLIPARTLTRDEQAVLWKKMEEQY